MIAISVTKARENIYQLLANVNSGSQPITITNSRGKNESQLTGHRTISWLD